jgi:ubiquinone/menaquinone biosynthesis C-methylase UbiE
MKLSSLTITCCPFCRGAVSPQEPPGGDALTDEMLACESCRKTFAIEHGIPRFIRTEELIGSNKKHEKLNNLFSHICTPATKLMFAVCGGEDKARRECLDRLERCPEGRILEIGIGTGDNLPYLVKRMGGGQLYGLDISRSMLHYCEQNLRKWNMQAELFLGEAEHLPFKDRTFDAIYHLGAINFFTDQKGAIQEMIRVAKPGTKIVIADESEKALKALDKLGLQLWIGKREEVIPPVDLVPKTMLDIRLDEIWKGYGYCIEFRTPAS